MPWHITLVFLSIHTFAVDECRIDPASCLTAPRPLEKSMVPL
jgi:hypothetical protein